MKLGWLIVVIYSEHLTEFIDKFQAYFVHFVLAGLVSIVRSEDLGDLGRDLD